MNLSRLNKNTSGLTLVEVLVVVGIIGILTAVIAVNAVQSGKLSRDAKRQADLRLLQSAIELYKNDKGRYPYGCNAPQGSWSDTWSGQIGTKHECPQTSSQYIIGLAPKYISVLPKDPKINGADSGYVYRTNEDGTVYKLMAVRTVEAELVDYNHEFKSCDIRPDDIGRLQAGIIADVDQAGWCGRATLAANEPPGSFGQYGTIPNCRMSTGSNNPFDGGNGRFDISYGIWGGFEARGNVPSNKPEEVRDTAVVICK